LQANTLAAFSSFGRAFGKKYSNAEEYEARYKIFKNNVHIIAAHNAESKHYKASRPCFVFKVSEDCTFQVGSFT
jgi:hypothetical protein